MKHVITLYFLLTIAVFSHAIEDHNKEKSKKQLPQANYQSDQNTLSIKGLEKGSRINILSENYEILLTFEVYNNSFNLSALDLEPGEYTVQMIGETTLNQHTILIH
ncbi:MAG: hypothetical protein HKP14_01295 [Bacteroidia bacterium]|nr:hypothetical protein [Bacteroidia bacterium]